VGDFGVEVEVVHFGEGHDVEGDVGEFFSEVGEVFAPCGEGFADFGGEESEFEWDVGEVEAFSDLVVPREFLGIANVHEWLPGGVLVAGGARAYRGGSAGWVWVARGWGGGVDSDDGRGGGEVGEELFVGGE